MSMKDYFSQWKVRDGRKKRKKSGRNCRESEFYQRHLVCISLTNAVLSRSSDHGLCDQSAGMAMQIICVSSFPTITETSSWIPKSPKTHFNTYFKVLTESLQPFFYGGKKRENWDVLSFTLSTHSSFHKNWVIKILERF